MIGAIIAKRKAHDLFAARNRGDIDAFLADWADDATLIFPGQSDMSGVFYGMPKIRKWFEQFCSQFPNVCFEIQDVFVKNIWAVGPSNRLAVEWNATLYQQDGQIYQNQGVTVVDIHGGKAVLVQDFIFDLSGSFFQSTREEPSAYR
jgi:ketosteroid isomerase-like protein